MGNLSNAIVTAFDNVSWDVSDTGEMRDQSMGALSQAIYDYVTDDSFRVVLATATGTLVGPPVVPYSGPIAVTITYNSAESLKTQLLSTLVSDNVANLFVALAAWLTAPIIVTEATEWIPSDIGTVAGVGITTFPAMVTQGLLANVALKAAMPDTPQGSWDTLEPFILIGLLGTIAIPLVSGLVGTAAFTGVGTGSVTYS